MKHKFKITDLIDGTEEVYVPMIDYDGNKLSVDERIKIKEELWQHNYKLFDIFEGDEDE